MAMSGAASFPITNLTAGTEVQIAEDGVLKPWIYLGQYTDGCCAVLRAECLPRGYNMRSVVDESVDYNGVERDTWLTGTYRNVFGTNLISALCSHEIPYYVWDGISLSVETITRDVYLASFYEMGGNSSEGGTNFMPALETYKGVTGNAARKTYYEGTETLAGVFLRSAHNLKNRFKFHNASNGVLDYMQATSPNGIRPMLSLNASAPVTETNDGYVVCL